MSESPDTQAEALAKTRAALRHEIGPPTDRDHKWQPMVSAGEVRRLLDALDERDARDAAVAAKAESLCHWVQNRANIQHRQNHAEFHFGNTCPYAVVAAISRGEPDPRDAATEEAGK